MNVHHKNADLAAAQQNLDLAVIGNGRTAALVNPLARIVWWCFPRFDGDPVFCRLLAGDEEKGFTDVLLDGFVSAHSEYVRNTAIVATVLTDKDGGAVGSPTSRRASSISAARSARRSSCASSSRSPACRASPSVFALRRIWPRRDAARVRQQPHPLYRRRFRHPPHHGCAAVLYRPRGAVRADAAGQPRVRRRHAARGRDSPPPAASSTTARAITGRSGSGGSAISYEWQDAVIRAAITLKLSAFEETGAIIAAHTTSIPEAPGSGRNWDYRFCWLRDAYFVVRALNRIGATRTMEDYISYILTIVSGHRPANCSRSTASYRPIRSRSASSPT